MSVNSNLIIVLRASLEYGIHVFGPSAFYGFLAATYPSIRKARFEKILIVANIVTLMIILILPFHVVSRMYMSYFLIALVVLLIVSIAKTIRLAIIDPEARIIFIAMCILAVTAAIDSLTAASFISSPRVVEYGQVMFLLAQGYVVSSRFARAFHTAQHLTDNLQIEVENQTREIRSVFDNLNIGIFTVEKEKRFGD